MLDATTDGIDAMDHNYYCKLHLQQRSDARTKRAQELKAKRLAAKGGQDAAGAKAESAYELMLRRQKVQSTFFSLSLSIFFFYFFPEGTEGEEGSR